MEFHIGLAELIAFSVALCGAGWVLLKVSLNQFEKRLDEKFKTLDSAVGDVKRLELELVRSDTRNAQLYMTKHDHDKVLERIFTSLERMEKKLDGKADTTECEARILRHVQRPK